MRLPFEVIHDAHRLSPARGVPLNRKISLLSLMFVLALISNVRFASADAGSSYQNYGGIQPYLEKTVPTGTTYKTEGANDPGTQGSSFKTVTNTTAVAAASSSAASSGTSGGGGTGGETDTSVSSGGGGGRRIVAATEDSSAVASSTSTERARSTSDTSVDATSHRTESAKAEREERSQGEHAIQAFFEEPMSVISVSNDALQRFLTRDESLHSAAFVPLHSSYERLQDERDIAAAQRSALPAMFGMLVILAAFLWDAVSAKGARMWTYRALGAGRVSQARAPARRKKENGKWRHSKLLGILLVIALIPSGNAPAFAATTVPLTQVYRGNLFTASGSPVTTEHVARFSFWNSADYVSGDVDGTGSINTSATHYIGWTETHTFTPGNSGYYSLELGSNTPISSMDSFSVSDLQNLYLQVEVKASGASDTTYDLLDADPNDASVDRIAVRSVPFASNADMLDQRDVGTGSGSIPVLQTGGVFSSAMIPGATQSGAFVIDSDGSETSVVTLQFGSLISRRLSYDVANARFNFSGNLRVQGNITATGAITLQGALSGATITSFGLSDCTGSSKLLWSASTHKFSCGADEGGSGGISYAQADSRYLQKQGGTVTGALLLTKSGIALNVVDTVSGSVMHAGTQLRSSGSLVVEGASSFEGNLTFGDALSDSVTVNAATWTLANDTNFVVSGGVNGLSFDTDTFSVDATNNRIGIRTTDPENPLEVVGTISGKLLHAETNVTASGSIIGRTSVVSQSALSGVTFFGAGLGSCSGASQKLLYNSVTGTFSCGSDQTGGAWSNTGSLAALFDGRYLNSFGDTMTGALTLNITGGNRNTVGLKALNTVSGAILHGETSLTSSGSLVVEGPTVLNSTLKVNNVDYTFPSADGTSGRILSTNGAGTLSWVTPNARIVCSSTSVPSGNTISNTATETAFTSTCTIPANTLVSGDVLPLRLWGVYSNAVVGPTIRAKVKINGTSALDTGTFTGPGAATNLGWSADIMFSVFTTGASGTVDAQGYLEFSTAATAALAINVPNTSTSSIDTTVDNTVSVTIQWGTASASNSATLRSMSLMRWTR